MRMVSEPNRFLEGWNTLTADDRDKAQKQWLIRETVTLRIDILERQPDNSMKIVQCSLMEHSPADLFQLFNETDLTARIADGAGYEYLIGVPPYEPPATATGPDNTSIPLFTAGDGETPDQFWLRLWNSCTLEQRVRVSECFFTYDHACLLENDGAIEIYGDENIHMHEIATVGGIFLRDERGCYAVDRSRDDALKLIADGGGPPLIFDFKHPLSAGRIVLGRETQADQTSPVPLVIVHPSSLRTKALYAKTIDVLALALADHGHEWTLEQRSLYDEAIDRLYDQPNALTAHEQEQVNRRRDK